MLPVARTPTPELATLHGRVVLITGGSRGLGAAIASTLGAAGMRLVLADIAVQRVQDFAAVLAEHDIDAIALPLDVSDPMQCVAAIDRVAQRFGRLDALVNNAAIDTTAPCGEVAAAEWQRIVATNLSAPFMLSNHAVALMSQQHDGHIVNVTATAAKCACAKACASCATQAGLPARSHAMHAELRPRGIQVTAVVVAGMCPPSSTARFAGSDSKQVQRPMHVAQFVRHVLQRTAAVSSV